jgi:hypothetical protein
MAIFYNGGLEIARSPACQLEPVRFGFRLGRLRL